MGANTCASMYVCMCIRARVCMNFSRSQDAHARGHGRHTSALGETLRPDPRSFLSPRFSVPRHPRVAQARTAFRISEGRATRTREGATAGGSVTAGVGAPGDSAGGGRGGRSIAGVSRSQSARVASSVPTLEENKLPTHNRLHRHTETTTGLYASAVPPAWEVGCLVARC